MRPARAHRGGRRSSLSLLSNQAGTAAIEFALVAPVLILMIYGIIEVGRGLWIQNAMQLAVEEGARFAMANPTATDAQVLDRARAMLAGLNTNYFTFTVGVENGTEIDYVTVSANHNFRFMVAITDDPQNRFIVLDAMSRQPRLH